jgi:hypothetical protein
MSHRFTTLAGAAGLALMLAAPAVWAQEQPVRVRGTIEKADGKVLTVKARDGSTVTVRLADNASIALIGKMQISDIKENSFIGVTGMPQPDGSQKALEVHIFPEPMRGTGEGFRPWDLQPNSTMTNATVASTVAATDGQTIVLKYKDGEKKIIVPPGTPIVTYLPGTIADLTPGAKIFVGAGQKQADGSIQTARITVGKGDLAPPM